jgi:hypothetical protein
MALIFDNDNNLIMNTETTPVTISGGVSVNALFINNVPLYLPETATSGMLALVSDVQTSSQETSAAISTLSDSLSYLESDVVRLTGDQDIYGFKTLHDNVSIHVDGDDALDMRASELSGYSEIAWSFAGNPPTFGVYVSESTEGSPIWTDVAAGKYISFWGYDQNKDLVTIDVSGNLTVNGGGIAILSLAETSCGAALTISQLGQIINSGYQLDGFAQKYQLDSYTLLTTTSALTGSLQAQINAICGSYELYTPLSTTAALTGSLQQQITVVSNSLSGYTTLSTTASLTGSLQQQISVVSNSLSGYITTTQAASITAGLTPLATTSALTSNLQSQIYNLSASNIIYSPDVILYWYDSTTPTNLRTATDNLANKLFWADYRTKRILSTGKSYGGHLVKSSASTITISAGGGTVIDQSVTDSSGLYPQYTDVSWGNITNVSLSQYISAGNIEVVHVLMDSTGTPFLQTSDPYGTTIRNNILLGRVSLRSGEIFLTRQYDRIPVDTYAQIEDLAYALGTINIYGNTYSASAGSISLEKSSGQTFRLGNVTSSIKNPSVIDDPALVPASLTYTYLAANMSAAQYVAASVNVDSSKYDNGSGTLQNVSGGYWTVQRVYYFSQSNNTYVWYGRNQYATFDDAQSGYVLEDTTIPPNSRFDSQVSFRALMFVKQGATDLSDPASCSIQNLGKLGDTGGTGGGGGGGGSQLTNFSDADFYIYDNLNNTHKLMFNLDDITDGAKTITFKAQDIAADIVLSIPISSGTLALVSDIAGISAALTPLATTAALTANLQTQINNISAPSLSGYTLLTTTAALTGNLQTQITNEVNARSSQIGQITGSPFVLDSRYYPSISADARFVHLTGNENISGNKNFGGVVRVNSDLYSFKYILGTGPDLSLLPVVGGQSVITTWWGLQLRANQQSSVEAAVSNVGGAGDYGVVVPSQTPTVSADIMQRGRSGQTADFFQWQNSSGAVLSRIRLNGNFGGDVDYTPAISANWVVQPTVVREALDNLAFYSNPGQVQNRSILFCYDDMLWGKESTTTTLGPAGSVGFRFDNANGGLVAPVNGELHHPGVIAVSTGTSNNSTGRGAITTSGSTTTSLAPSGKIIFEGIVEIPTLSVVATEYTAIVGITDTSTATPNNGIYFIYDRVNGGNTWRAATANGGSRTLTNTASVVANAWYRLKFIADYTLATPQVQFFVDDVLQTTITTNLTLNLCSPRFQILKTGSSSTNSRSLYVDYFSMIMTGISR